MAGKTVAQLRIEDRYHGDPKTRPGARARQRLDDMLTSDAAFMKDAVTDTGRILGQVGREKIDDAAGREARKLTLERAKKLRGKAK